MYKSCHTQKAASQQKAFEDALLQLMKVKTLERITVVELCERTKLSRKVFYRLFDTKQDVALSLIDHTLMGFSYFKPEGCRNDLQRFLLFWKTNREWLDALLRNNLVGTLMECILRLIAEEKLAVQVFFGATEPSNKENILLFNISGMMGVIINWHRNGYKKSTDEMALLLHTLMMNPLVHTAKN